MKLRHPMPFGAELDRDGSTRFRLWAPAAARVELQLGEAALPMRADGEGWFELRAAAPAGSRYAFRIDGGLVVPDPASRCNPDDVHGASMVVDAYCFDWPDDAWHGRPWEEAVIYELHVGSFSASGDYAGVEARLDYLVDLGVTAIELMPLADFPGTRNWGYDGVLLYAPDTSYGTPDDLKRLVAAAHARGLMVLLDVVYNHFGPEGNYLHAYAPQFFNPDRHTPWGAALNFDGEGAATVRDFFIHNALYWIEEYHLDGLRLDAVHAITDQSQPGFIADLAAAVHYGPGANRCVHLILENEFNQARHLGRGNDRQPGGATAQWNDDVHHALHVLVTGEDDGYYMDYAPRPLWLLGRAQAEGFGYQGETSALRAGAARGEPSLHLPAPAFVDFLQNHDQIGNRAFGERIAALADEKALRAAVACLLLSPHIPLLFMGEEFAAGSPFLFFCDFHGELAAAVREGRRGEFARFEKFRAAPARAAIPDPTAAATFEASRLRWSEVGEPGHKAWHEFYRELLHLRRTHIVPRLAAIEPGGSFRTVGETGLRVAWRFADGAQLHLAANFSARPSAPGMQPVGRIIHASHAARQDGTLEGWATAWTLEQPAGAAP